MEKGAPNAAKLDASSSSHYIKTVVLREWWLVPSQKEFEGRTLSVSGLPVEERAVRVFTSAPVVKRHGVFTLETSDGVYVILRGFINRPRTEESGFPYQVFNHFLFGFPLNWEEYAGRKSGDDGCPCPIPSPRRTTENGSTPPLLVPKESQNIGAPAVEDVDVIEANTANNSKIINDCTKNDIGATSGVKEVKTKLKYGTEESLSEQESLVSPPVSLPEISSLKKSRSGRLLVRPLEFWRNQKAVYDSSRQITGIVDGRLESGEASGSGTIKNSKRKHKGGKHNGGRA